MDDLVSRSWLLSEYDKRHKGPPGGARKLIEEAPPAQPKMGKWIYHIDDLFPAESTMECNQCRAEQPLTCDDEFCPHCGADMRGEQDDSI